MTETEGKAGGQCGGNDPNHLETIDQHQMMKPRETTTNAIPPLSPQPNLAEGVMDQASSEGLGCVAIPREGKDKEGEEAVDEMPRDNDDSLFFRSESSREELDNPGAMNEGAMEEDSEPRGREEKGGNEAPGARRQGQEEHRDPTNLVQDASRKKSNHNEMTTTRKEEIRKRGEEKKAMKGTTHKPGNKGGAESMLASSEKRKFAEVEAPDEETHKALAEIAPIDRAFPPGSAEKVNRHPTMSDQEIIAAMRDAMHSRKKRKLREVASDVWDRKGNLKQDYHYILCLANSSDQRDSLTTIEKQTFIDTTPKYLRHAQFPEVFNSEGEIRPRAMSAFIQPRNQLGLVESPVYNPNVLPTNATYATALAGKVATPPTAADLGKKRLSAQAREFANQQRALRLEKAAFYEIQQEFRTKYAEREKKYEKMSKELKELQGKLMKAQCPQGSNNCEAVTEADESNKQGPTGTKE